ncbi:LacI family DNA-binding transcriptional regulator [Virgibacillus sp. C22-A2]|uniref:LacI family DNA-binding transcriptional regulator n=1 Tax=Virgibacillus tibetensis TaxID=3042313 RepID=A0ABU6KDH8_9BACI|nr:LacI family DNA-binding transcriptional regulator [Virgibacillus sp. C22-A2]
MSSVKRKGERVTLKEVAKHAGVSTATVSYVINNTRYVSDKLKSSVLNAVDELGYSPNNIARSLRSNQTYTIGLIVSNVENPFYTEIARAIEEKAYSEGYSVIICNSEDDILKETNYLKLLQSKRLDGIILAPAPGENEHLYYVLQENSMPIVLLNRKLDVEGIPIIKINNRHSAERCVNHLIETHGYRDIGAVIGSVETLLSKDRYDGFVHALNSFGLPVRNEWIIHGNSSFAGGYKALKHLMGKDKRPEAIFIGGSLMYLGVLSALKELHLKCPEDIALIGFSEMRFSHLLEPPLSTIHQPAKKLAELSLEVLLQQISGIERKQNAFELETELIIRNSCGCNKM